VSTAVEGVVCPACGCLCDDLRVELAEDRIVSVRRACGYGRRFFTAYEPTPRRPTVGGREVSWDEAVLEAAQILHRADSPLVYGLSCSSVEAQRKAVEMADWLGATLDTTSSVCHGPTTLAMQMAGEPTCTLGAVRDRADLLIFWGCNPAISHPRHFARYSLIAKGQRTPNGRRDRVAVVVDVRPTATTRVADVFLQVEPGADFEVLAVLRALVQEKQVGAEQVGGIPVVQLAELARQMKICRFGVIFAGVGLTMSPGQDLTVSELLALAIELNGYTRFSVVPMRGHGNVAGADQVLAWQTGYPFAVNLAGGYPRFGPGEFSAVDLLRRGEVDAALILASDPAAHLPAAAARLLGAIPSIVLDPGPSLTAREARVVLPTACSGVDATGTMYRMDGVPIRLRPVLAAARPTDEQVVDQILEAVRGC
jgi:formylmethanofuran dehydrogenase subunit B